MKNIVDFTSKIKDKFAMRKDIAPVEESSTASRAYSAGDKFFYGNLLQKAITDIAQGASLVGGTNFENADPVTTTIQNLSNLVKDDINIMGAKNMCPTMTVDANSDSMITVNKDDTVTFSGTATARNSAISSKILLPAGKYIIGGCPSGGDWKTYRLVIMEEVGNDPTYEFDYGTPIEVTLAVETNVTLRADVYSGQTVSNLTFKPFIVPKNIYTLNPEYAPYAKTNRELTEDNETLLDFYNNNKPIDAGDTLSFSRCAGYGIADANNDVEFFFPLPRKVKSPRVCTFVSGTLEKCRGHAQNITDATLVNVVVQRDNVLCIKLHSSSFTPFAVYIVIYEQLNVSVNS